MNRAAFTLARTVFTTRLNTVPHHAQWRPILPAAYLRTSAILLGEPMKKKKKSDPQDTMQKLSKRAKKFEKAIKKLEKLGRRLKLVEEIEGSRKIRSEIASRVRDTPSAEALGEPSASGSGAKSSAVTKEKEVGQPDASKKAGGSETASPIESERAAKRALKKKKKAEKAAEEEALAKQPEPLSRGLRLSEAEVERRALLKKRWTRYQAHLTALDDAQLRAQLLSVDHALSELKLTNATLYERAIEVDQFTVKRAVEDESIAKASKDSDVTAKKGEVATSATPQLSANTFSMLPFEGCGPTLTRSLPSSLYEAPDGEYLDTTRNYELGIDVSIYVRPSASQQKVITKDADDDGDD